MKKMKIINNELLKEYLEKYPDLARLLEEIKKI
jgi:cell fate (sporulation/competence/biofilm development) regulator YlbF (YheA/YmcA/DUF963 family)